jgi:N4-gp56 family major capsid protein
MADTALATGLRVQQWDSKFFLEYLTENRYSGEMGTNENSIIQLREDVSKKPGDSITFALVNKLINQATTGSNVLEGNEEDMTSRSFRMFVDKRRNAVRIPEMEEVKSPIDLRNAARAILKEWALKDTEGLISQGLMGIHGVNYLTASAGQKNTWLADNTDRVLFGALKSNNTGTFSTSLANIDNTADKLSAAALSQMKRIALAANPRVRPVRVEGGGAKRWYTVHANSLGFRDLKGDATITQAQREVKLEVQNSKLFEGGDIVWDGMIVKETPDLDQFLTASTIQVGPVILCGAQAVGAAYAKRWTSQTKTFDYGDKFGVATESIYGIKKLEFGTGANDTDTPKDNGVVTGWFAAVADA